MKREAEPVGLHPETLQSIAREIYRLADRMDRGEVRLVSGEIWFSGLQLKADAVFEEVIRGG